MPYAGRETRSETLQRRPSAIFDLDGVFLESARRRWAVYLVVFARFSHLWPLASPLSFVEYRQRLGTVKHSANLYPLDPDAAEYDELFSRVKGEYEKVLREYRPEHLELNEVIPGARGALHELVRELAYVSLVSFRFMEQRLVVEELIRHDLVVSEVTPPGSGYSTGRLRPISVNVVGSDQGAALSKSAFIAEHYHAVIKEAEALGTYTHLVGDALTDMQAAFALQKLGLPVVFVGITATGEANEERFREEAARQQQKGHTLPAVHYFSDIAATVPFFRELREEHEARRGRRLRVG